MDPTMSSGSGTPPDRGGGGSPRKRPPTVTYMSRARIRVLRRRTGAAPVTYIEISDSDEGDTAPILASVPQQV